MTKDQALALARAHIADEGCVIIEGSTLETEFGWIFFYDSRQYAETGDEATRVVGNAPLLVDRHTGELHVTGTARPIEHYVEAYRKHGTPHPDSGQ